MRRAVWTEDELSIDEADPPPLAPGWARLRVEACGICGSDLHFWHRQIARPLGSAPGHEFAGTLIDGPAGHDLADVRYVGSPAIFCGTCEYCTIGATHLCGRGAPGIGLGRDGGVADFVDLPVRNLFPVADSVDARLASLGEPLAVGIRGIGIAAPAVESRVLVLGAGTVGLIVALLARDRAAEVAITARYPHQRAAAERLGVTVLGESDAVDWGKEHRPDVVIETVGGTADTMNIAIRLAHRGGRIVVVGTFQKVPVDLFRAQLKELEILTSFAYGTNRRGSEFATAVQLLPRFREELSVLQTHEFPLDRANDAFATAADKSSEALKVTVVP